LDIYKCPKIKSRPKNILKNRRFFKSPHIALSLCSVLKNATATNFCVIL
jgi:hypothetical protein